MEEVTVTRNMITLGSINLFYLDTKTDGSVILCLHGRWGRAETWYDFMLRYGKKYRVIAPDQRGHGLSGKPVSKYTAEEMAGDIVELLNALHIDSVILVGHSMGGRVAGYLAALYPQRVKALALLDKSPAGPAEPSSLPVEEVPAIDPLTKGWPMPFPSLSAAMDFIRQETDSELGYQYFMKSLTETAEGFRMLFSPQAMAANIAYEQSWYHLLPTIQCQSLLIRSSSHEAVPDGEFTKMQALMPNCIAREVSHPDHNVHLGNKEEFYSYFDEFLAKWHGEGQ